MKIKHKETNIERNPSFGEWIREYVRKGLYKEWEVSNLENVVKVIYLKKDGKVSETLMSKRIAEKHKNQFNGVNGISVEIEKGIVSMEYYNEYLYTKILKIKNQSLFKRFLSNLLAIFNPKTIPKKKAEPVSRNELVGIIGVVIAFIMLMLFIIVEWDNIYSFFNN
jgi:hypothetical protein